MIPFNKASISDLEVKYVTDALLNSKSSGDGPYTMKVYEEFKKRFGIMEELAQSEGKSISEYNLEELDKFWDKAKEILRKEN